MKKNIHKNRHTVIILLLISMASFPLEGCSSVHVAAKQASKADDTYNKTVWALWWGGSDPLENVDCRGNGLQVVSYKTNWIYSICSFVTLGAVVPVDVEYRCTEGSLQGGGTLGSKEERGSDEQ